MERRTSLVTVLCVFIIGILATLLTLSVTGVINIKELIDNDDNNVVDKDEDNNGDEISYKEYKKFDEVTLSNGTKWVVIKDSDKTQDYVTLLSKEEFVLSDNDVQGYGDYFVKVSADDYSKIFSQAIDANATYNGWKLKEILENKIILNIPINLKEVDGYKIRLITIDEIMQLDNNWVYDEQYDSYQYNGTDLATYLRKILTMTKSRNTSGRTVGFHKLSTSYNDMIPVHYISAGMIGFGGVKPVINVYKTELD